MNYKHLLLSGIFSSALLLLCQGETVAQQQEATATAQKATVTVVEEQENLRQILDLGYFQMKDYRPTRNETVKLAFHMHVVLNEHANEQTVKQLEYWKHRLRNQVLIAVRLSRRQDFLEAGLQRFRHIVQIRINRLLKSQLIDDILLTEFTFATN